MIVRQEGAPGLMFEEKDLNDLGLRSEVFGKYVFLQ
jgi:hypothetical protein